MVPPMATLELERLEPLAPAEVDPVGAVRLWRAVLEQAVLDALAGDAEALLWLETPASVDYVLDNAALDPAAFRKWCGTLGLRAPEE